MRAAECGSPVFTHQFNFDRVVVYLLEILKGKELKEMFVKRIFSVLAVFTAPVFAACAQGPGSFMGNGGNRMGCAYGGGFMWLIVLILAGIGIYFLFRISKSKGSDGSLIETPSDILNRRYANGEINKEEFDRMKNDLES